MKPRSSTFGIQLPGLSSGAACPQFFKHFRDYVLEEPEDAGVVCNAQAAQPAVLVTADTWLVQLLGLRGKGYLDVLAEHPSEPFLFRTPTS